MKGKESSINTGAIEMNKGQSKQIDLYSVSGTSPPTRTGGIKLVPAGDGRVRPVILCDVCGEQIVGDNGIVVFFDAAESAKLGAETSFVHKGSCDQKFSSHRLTYWYSLNTFLFRLIYNTEVDLGAAKRLIETWSPLV